MFRSNEETLDTLRQRWRTLRHVGAATPWVRAWVRTAKLQRAYEHVSRDEVFGRVPGVLGPHQIFAGRWKAHSAYVELPNIASVRGVQNFQQNGLQSLTVEVDNLALKPESGDLGNYHLLRRGYYSPFHGYKAPHRIRMGEKNEWFDLLNDQSTELTVCAGYGDAGVPIFRGTLDNSDLTSRPDKITLTARDLGKYLTDQYIFQFAKIPDIPDPITFADRKRTLADPKINVRKAKWILIDDASDIIKIVLQWCGLRDWEVESTGVRLSKPKTFNRGNHMIDVINWLEELTSYVFYMKPPHEFDPSDLSRDNETNLSMGIPVFRNTQAMKTSQQVRERIEIVDEHGPLQGVEPRFDNIELPFSIRVRGARANAAHGGRRLGGDVNRRFMYVYRPPWSRNDIQFPDGTGHHDFSNGSLKNYEVYHNERFDTIEDCKIAALFIAFRHALEANKATFETPWFPTMLPDSQVTVRDAGTGLSTRVYISDRSYEMTTGEQPKYSMSLGGSLLDAPDIVVVRKELIEVLNHNKRNPGLDATERRRLRRQRHGG